MPSATDPTAALDEAIQRSVGIGWRLVRRKGLSADLTDVTGSQHLRLETGPDGMVRDQQRIGTFRQPMALPWPSRGRMIQLAALACFGLVLGGVLAVLASRFVLKDSTGVASAPALTPENVARTLQAETGSLPDASFRRLSVALTGDGVVLAIEPRLRADSNALPIASSDALIAAAHLFHDYPDLQTITVAIFARAGGQGTVRLLTTLQLSAATAARLDYSALAERVWVDGAVLYCQADGYSITPALYTQLQALHLTDCLSAPAR